MQIHWWSEICVVHLSFSSNFFHFLQQGNNVSNACCIIAFVLETFKSMVTLICDDVFHDGFCSFFLKDNFFVLFFSWYLIAKVLKMIGSRSFIFCLKKTVFNIKSICIKIIRTVLFIFNLKN